MFGKLQKMKFLLLLSIALLLACSPQEEGQAPVSVPWLKPMDSDKHEFIKYPNFLYQGVQESLLGEAIAGLGDKPLLQLSTSEAERYAGNDLRMPMELRPFLIHALTRPGGRHVVYFADRALWVDCVGGSGDDSQLTKTPLIIFIDEVPPDVFVTAGQSSEYTFPE